MFNDPLLLGPGDVPFHRVGDGKYVHSASTADQPSSFEVKSDIKAQGTSSFAIKRNHAENNPEGGVDLKAEVYLVVRGDLDKIAQTTITSLYADVADFFSEAGNYERILRGER